MHGWACNVTKPKRDQNRAPSKSPLEINRLVITRLICIQWKFTPLDQPTNQPTNQPTDQPWLQLPITSWIDSRVKNLTYLWLFLPQLHVVYSQWITVVVIELLAWLLNCCVITELINIIFPDLYTQNTQINKKLTISLFYWAFFKNYTKFRRKRWGAVPSDHPQIHPSMIFEYPNFNQFYPCRLL